MSRRMYFPGNFQWTCQIFAVFKVVPVALSIALELTARNESSFNRFWCLTVYFSDCASSVSYTHLDVYKRQAMVSGVVLSLTSVLLMCFYIKQFVDDHKEQLGILKALG